MGTYGIIILVVGFLFTFFSEKIISLFNLTNPRPVLKFPGKPVGYPLGTKRVGFGIGYRTKPFSPPIIILKIIGVVLMILGILDILGIIII